jgi:hypothetical protein
MNAKTFLFGLGLATGAALGPPAALAQTLQPTPRPAKASVPAGFTCTAEALNVSAYVDSASSVVIYDVPSSLGAARVRLTCDDGAGHTAVGQSAPVVPVPGGVALFGAIDFGTSVPIAARLAVSPPGGRLIGLGSTEQLAVSASFADLSTGDVTAAASGTTYRSSNPAVATVSANGLVTAVGPGSALIYALNDGAGGLATVSVLPASVQSLSVTPASVSLTQSPIFLAQPARLQVTGTLAGGATVDLTPASSGTTYTSSDPSIAAVSASGAIAAVSVGSAVITVSDGPSGLTRQVPVTVSAFSPAPFAAYDTPGYAYNVDLDGNLAFIADGPGGLQILDVSSGATVGKLSFGGALVLDVRLRGKLAAVALGGGGFALADVSNPAQPVTLSITPSSGVTGDLWVSGEVLYAAASDGLHVYDISNPTAPVALGVQAFAAAANAVAADSARGIAVVLTNEPALVVLRTGGPLPWPSVSVPLPAAVNQADDVILSGTSAYVADGTAGLIEVDVTNPATPFVRSASTLTFNAVGVALRRSKEGTVVAAADNKFVNAVPLFDDRLDNTYNIDFSTFPGDVQFDANGTGIALGDGFGVMTVGDVGIQVFRTQQLVDNAGVPPTVALTQPTTGGVVPPGDLYVLSAAATDDVAVAFVDFLIDGTVVATDATPPFSASAFAGAPCSTQTMQARATDVGGNVSLSIPIYVSVLCADGQACSTGADCASGLCGGGTCQSCTSAGVVLPDCAALKAACPNAASGTYTIDPDGPGPAAPFAAYCEMALAGGGWTMVAKMTNQDAKHWIDAKTSWTDAVAYGDTSDLATGNDAKSPAWGSVVATDFMLTDDASKASGGFVQTTSACVGGLTMSEFFTNALANYPDTSGDTYYRQCATRNSYVPNWATETTWEGQTALSPSNSLNRGYVTIAYANGGDTQAVISFYALGIVLAGPTFLSGTESEADLGLGNSERNGQAFGLNDGEKQDIGGGLDSPSMTDASCRAQYPETVYVFAR